MTDTIKRSQLLREVDALFKGPENWIVGQLFGKIASDDAPVYTTNTNKYTGKRFIPVETYDIEQADCFCILGAIDKVLYAHGLLDPATDSLMAEAAKHALEYVLCAEERVFGPSPDQAAYIKNVEAKNVVISDAKVYVFNDNHTATFEELKSDLACAIALAEKRETDASNKPDDGSQDGGDYLEGDH
ncbi:MAG: hypothetical protein KKH61_21445 [Gammaproteobacteria bacterium]|uniref:Uncharacterized protein n=1 Tax=viral metagenome TaxID=1070528 RepID=A0A6H1ZBG8_9ZZZZ|nr:hypothetical protein [Gammaproteobacteria bacterium]